MPSEDEIASTIDELTRKLQGVPEEKVRQELKRFLDHGVPLHQAKQDIQRTLSSGSTPRSEPATSVRRKVAEIDAQDQNVDVLAKIIHVNEREITARGEKKTIWSGLLGDETGVVAFTAWRDAGLTAGDVLEIRNAYVTTWQDDPQVNIGDHAQIEPVDRELDVPTPVERSEEMDIGALEDGQRSVTVTGRVLSSNEREITVKGEPRTLWEGQLADATGRIPFTAWHDFELEQGEVLTIANGYVRSFRGVPQLNFGENAAVQRPTDHDVPPPDALSDVEGPSLEATEREIGELTPGMSSVAVTGRVLHVRERDIQVKGEPRTLWEGELADASGRIPFTAWHDFKLEPSEAIDVTNAYVRSFRGLPQLNFGENAQVDRPENSSLPPIEALDKPRDISIDELQQAQGAVGVRVEAVCLEIRSGSGLILRCPECRRVLQQGECQLHGRVEGIADLRIKAIVDDGGGSVMALFDRQTTEDVLGRSLADCQQAAEEAKSFEVIEDELKAMMQLERVAVEGNATFDDYGTTLMVNRFEILDHEDAEARAEDLINRVHALQQEVAT